MKVLDECIDKFSSTMSVEFRPFKEIDLNDFYEYASDFETTQFLTWPTHKTMGQSYEILMKYYIGNNYCLAIINKKESKCIGSITLIPNVECDKLSFGIVINKKYWCKGIGTEVCSYLIDFAFNTLNVKKVEAELFKENKASEKMMLKSGMRMEKKGKLLGKETLIYSVNKTETNRQVFKALFVNPPTVSQIPEYAKGISYYSWLKTKGKFYSFVPGELLGAQCIQSYVYKHNVNCSFEILNGCLEEHISVEQTTREIIKKFPIDLLCISGPYDVFPEILQIAETVCQNSPKTKILYGQFFASLCYEQILKKYSVFDYISVGYGEITISKLIEHLQSEKEIVGIPGLAYRFGDEIVCRELQECEFDEIIGIRPTRENVEKVMASGLNVSIFASRGCPYRCSFCVSGSLMGKCNGYRLRDPYDVVDELEYLYNKYNLKRITFVDDTFAPNSKVGKEQARIIAEEIIRRRIKIEIMIDSRIDCIEKELFTLLYKAGVKYIYVGIEAANNRNLKKYNKGYDADKIKNNLDILQEIGINVIYGFINFNPETTYDDLLINIEMLRELDNIDPSMLSHEFIPYPGTIMTQRLLDEGLLEGEFPNYILKYKNSIIKKLKKEYDKLLGVYTSFLLKMNVYPEFYINSHEQVYREINILFADYLFDMVYFAKENNKVLKLFEKYENRLKQLLKQILIEERNIDRKSVV